MSSTDFTRSYEITHPAGTEAASLGDERIRYLKVDLEERLEDMLFGFNADDGTGNEDMYGVKKLRFRELAADPTILVADNDFFLYTKNVSDISELFFRDNTDTVKQLTNDGKLNIAAADIPNDTIDSQHYAAGSIDLEHMSANSIDSDQYVDGSIDLAHMSAESVDSDQYVDGSIDAEHLASGACWHHDGTQVYDTDAVTTFTDLDLSSYVGSNRALVFLKIKNNGAAKYFAFRTNGDTENVSEMSGDKAGGSSFVVIGTGNIGYVTIETDAAGIVEWKCASAVDTDIWIMGYVK